MQPDQQNIQNMALGFRALLVRVLASDGDAPDLTDVEKKLVADSPMLLANFFIDVNRIADALEQANAIALKAAKSAVLLR